MEEVIEEMMESPSVMIPTVSSYIMSIMINESVKILDSKLERDDVTAEPIGFRSMNYLEFLDNIRMRCDRGSVTAARERDAYLAILHQKASKKKHSFYIQYIIFWLVYRH